MSTSASPPVLSTEGSTLVQDATVIAACKPFTSPATASEKPAVTVQFDDGRILACLVDHSNSLQVGQRVTIISTSGNIRIAPHSSLPGH